MRIGIALAAVAALGLGAPASAQFVSVNYVIGGTGSGTISLAYDAGTSTYSLLDFDYTIAGVHFDETRAGIIPYKPNEAFQGVFVGGLIGGVSGFGSGTNDFIFPFAPNYPAESTQAQGISYAVGGALLSGSVRINQLPPAAVPEPATWAMMLLGFGAVGMAMRRGRKAIRAAA